MIYLKTAFLLFYQDLAHLCRCTAYRARYVTQFVISFPPLRLQTQRQQQVNPDVHKCPPPSTNLPVISQFSVYYKEQSLMHYETDRLQ